MIAFIFGTFNPVTLAHVEMGKECRRVLGDSCRVVYVPDSEDYIRKAKGLTDEDIIPNRDRIRLLREAVTPFGFEVTLVEVEGISDGKAYNTVRCFEDDDKYLCVGADNVQHLNNWYMSRELLNECGLVVFSREGYDFFRDYLFGLFPIKSYRTIKMDYDLYGLSSTRVRLKCKLRMLSDVQRMVPDNVYEYLVGFDFYDKSKEDIVLCQ